ncbi:hypothetical protein IAT38_000771 [Cryptococcus sp. DSM 104549]
MAQQTPQASGPPPGAPAEGSVSGAAPAEASTAAPSASHANLTPSSSSASTSGSAAAPSSAPTPAHPAFPSLPPPTSRSSRSHHAAAAPSLPTTPAQLIQLFQQDPNVALPAIMDVADGKAFTGLNLKSAEKRALADDFLALAKESDGGGSIIYTLPDEQIEATSGGLVHVLSARFNVASKGDSKGDVGFDDALLDFSIKVCLLGDPEQFIVAHQRVTMFAWGLLRLAQNLKKVPLVVPAIYALVVKSCTPNTFSGLYGAFLEACLITREYEQAQLVLDQVFFNVKGAGLSYLDFLTYYHHAGTVSIALGDFAKAKEYFVAAITLPTTEPSAIQIACAKRAILCELIVNGKRVSWPKFTPPTVSRSIEKYAAVYIEVAKEYESQNWAAVRKIVGHDELRTDRNRGLFDAVVNSIPRRQVLRLRETYSRLTVADLTRRMGLESGAANDVIGVLQGMVSSGQITATLTQSSGGNPGQAIVAFTDAGNQFTSSSANEQLAQARYIAGLLEGQLTAASKRIGSTKEYLKKQAQLIEMGGKKGSKGADDFDQLIDAEDDGNIGGLVVPPGSKKSVSTRVGGDHTDMGY